MSNAEKEGEEDSRQLTRIFTATYRRWSSRREFHRNIWPESLRDQGDERMRRIRAAGKGTRYQRSERFNIVHRIGLSIASDSKLYRLVKPLSPPFSFHSTQQQPLSLSFFHLSRSLSLPHSLLPHEAGPRRRQLRSSPANSSPFSILSSHLSSLIHSLISLSPISYCHRPGIITVAVGDLHDHRRPPPNPPLYFPISPSLYFPISNLYFSISFSVFFLNFSSSLIFLAANMIELPIHLILSSHFSFHPCCQRVSALPHPFHFFLFILYFFLPPLPLLPTWDDSHRRGPPIKWAPTTSDDHHHFRVDPASLSSPISSFTVWFRYKHIVWMLTSAFFVFIR
ncbi:hypothetical protein CKAN_02738300 [Cinnamomum micranthum f. kanehirae]|uniref:Uncharacterized protein n=1 Tax=Cinnamomum micranthum f. kanehirae TaxID=337451 RepID=A0A443Q4F5_9MAGN|nr:hypothetical protein CKAN_02738300 [Cinnamomum micranthum f. kanehirae]